VLAVGTSEASCEASAMRVVIKIKVCFCWMKLRDWDAMENGGANGYSDGEYVQRISDIFLVRSNRVDIISFRES
jgi:hypothetical protein